MHLIKKTTALVLAIFLASAGISSPIVFAVPIFSATESTVAYCSMPLQVPVGNGAYDYQYFVYASKMDASDLDLNIDSGSLSSLENLYPGSHAQMNGNKITIDENTAFILHGSGNNELVLSSAAGIQLAPSRKCDELVTVMLLMHEGAKQNTIRNEDLTSAEIDLIRTLVAATRALEVRDFYGGVPNGVLPSDNPQVGADEILKYLNDNELRGQPLLDNYHAIISETRAQNYNLYTDDQTENFLYKKYSLDWLTEFEGKIPEEKLAILNKFVNAQDRSQPQLSFSEMKQMLEIVTQEKMYKHPSEPGKLLSLTEYLNKAYSGVGVEFRISMKSLTSQEKAMVSTLQTVVRLGQRNLDAADRYEIYAPDENTIHLQALRRGTNELLSEVPIFPDVNSNDGYCAAVMSPNKGENGPTIMVVDTDSALEGSLQRLVSTIVHESNHVTTKATGAQEWLFVGDGTSQNPNIFANEGIAEFYRRIFQLDQNNPGFMFADLSSDVRFLRSSEYETRVSYNEADKLFQYIYDKRGGQATIDGIMRGDIKIGDLIDIRGLHALYRVDFVIPFLDVIGAQLDDFHEIYAKETEIRTTLESGDILNPDMAKIDKFIADLDALELKARNNPLITNDELHMNAYALRLKDRLNDYRYSPINTRAQRYEDFAFKGVSERDTLLGYLNEKIASEAKFYHGINTKLIPEADFKAVEDAADRVLEKTQSLKQLREITYESKSMAALDAAENSILKLKVPEELKSPLSAAKKLATGTTAIAAGTTIFFVLGSQFARYGEENDNPYLFYSGTAVEYLGIFLTIASAGATIANAMGYFVGFSFLIISLTPAFVVGTIIGGVVMMVLESLYCAAVSLFDCMYVQPVLTLGKTSAFTGDTIKYEISGFDVPNGIGNQDGKTWRSWAAMTQLGAGCTVSGGICKGEFNAPLIATDNINIFAKDNGNQFVSTSANLLKLRSQTILDGTFVTDKNYGCTYSGEWNGETSLNIVCAPL